MANDGIKFFAVDSRMKLRITGGEAEYLKIAKMSSQLSECAIKNDIIILLINQISEEDLKSGRLSFKGSGDQIYDTDMALFIVIKEDDNRQLICTKNRQDEFMFKVDLPKTYDGIRVKEIPYVHEEIKMEAGMIL
jgi:replicative DNA helicase